MRFLLAGLMLLTLGAQAQEYEVRSEFMYCKFNENTSSTLTTTICSGTFMKLHQHKQ